MAEILSLPCRIDHEGARRLASALTAMIRDGHDARPRGAQIRSLGLTLEAHAQALRVELTRLGMTEHLDAFTRALDRLVHVASSYEADRIA